MAFPPSVPQIFALLFLATIAAFVAELLVRNAPPLGFVGGIVFGLVGVWFFANLPWLDLSIEPRLEDIPAVRAVLGGVIIVAIFAMFVKGKVFDPAMPFGVSFYL